MKFSEMSEYQIFTLCLKLELQNPEGCRIVKYLFRRLMPRIFADTYIFSNDEYFVKIQNSRIFMSRGKMIEICREDGMEFVIDDCHKRILGDNIVEEIRKLLYI